MISLLRPGKRVRPTLAVSMVPTRSPWGGSSPFVSQLTNFLWRRGWHVVFHLQEKPDIILVIDPRMDHPAKRFGLKQLISFRQKYPEVPIVLRINDCDQRKGTQDIDELLRMTHELSHYTVFISEWLRDYFAAKWFDLSRPNSVIYNGADPSIYHPFRTRLPDEPVRIVTHHWSNNPLKGFDEYQELDDLIATGGLPHCKFRILGRWPSQIVWKTAETIRPLTGHPLARRLRECHLYLTASRWEPGGMHHVEGAQCGLPLVYHEDGGGIVEAGKKYGVSFRTNLREAVLEAIERLPELRAKVLSNPPSGDRMVLDYANILQKLVVLGPS
jgi:glycosyltransferase involved in cell wall biosynthesis